jgi:hypothetical protein
MLSKQDCVLGAQIKFKPSCWYAQRAGRQGGDIHILLPGGTEVTGTVDYINEAHGYFRVRYEVFGNVNHECFKFQQKNEDPAVWRSGYHPDPIN